MAEMGVASGSEDDFHSGDEDPDFWSQNLTQITQNLQQNGGTMAEMADIAQISQNLSQNMQQNGGNLSQEFTTIKSSILVEQKQAQGAPQGNGSAPYQNLEHQQFNFNQMRG